MCLPCSPRREDSERCRCSRRRFRLMIAFSVTGDATPSSRFRMRAPIGDTIGSGRRAAPLPLLDTPARKPHSRIGIKMNSNLPLRCYRCHFLVAASFPRFQSHFQALNMRTPRFFYRFIASAITVGVSAKQFPPRTEVRTIASSKPPAASDFGSL
jgi:hypothetical protein